MKAVCWVTELVFSSHSQCYIKVILWTLFIPDFNQHEHQEIQPQHLQMQTSSVVLVDLIHEKTREQIYPEHITLSAAVASVAGLQERLCWQLVGRCWISPRHGTGERKAEHGTWLALSSETLGCAGRAPFRGHTCATPSATSSSLHLADPA